MKILIVEDEHYTRKALIKIIKGKYDSTILEAENGLKALEYLKHEPIDIIVTDIRMPEMNGLELAEKVKDLHPNVFVIIVSGYSEFEYAQKALKLKVKDYILKPLEKEEIFKVLDNVIREIDEIASKNNYDAQYKKNAEHAIEQQKLSNIIRKKESLKKEDFTGLLSVGLDRICYRIILVRYKKLFTEEIKQQIEDIFQDNPNIKAYFHYANRNEMLIFSYGHGGKKQYEEEIYSRHEFYIKSRLLTSQTQEYVVGISQTHDHIEAFSIAYDEARQSLFNYFFLGWGKVYIYHETADITVEPMRVSNDLLRRFENGLRNGDEVLSSNALKKIFELLINQKNHAATAIQLIFMKLEITMDEIAKEHNISLNTMAGYDQFNDIVDITKYFEQLIITICKEINRKNKDMSIINSLLIYMENNYFEPLSLGEIADEMYYMNASYLSRLFKEKVGDTFSNSLLKIRMQKAKQLLEEQDISITEVATLVGYDNAAYFIKTFKSFYQQTPGQYRRQELEN